MTKEKGFLNLRTKLIFNKRNGQINLGNLKKRDLPVSMRKKLSNPDFLKKMRVNISIEDIYT